MLKSLFRLFYTSRNDKLLKKYNQLVLVVNALEPQMQQLADSAFPEVTQNLKKRLAAGESLDDLLPEAFALTREASRRVNNERHFDVQLIGGMALHNGQISEMKTGEGKTLACTSPAYLNALTGKGVHVVTPNDYLARRDAHWMGRVYQFLGLTVGLVQHGQTDDERRQAYAADITYGTNNEFGFDYLRDNMKFRLEDYVQRGFHFAIVDEVDSILVDEARTPLIISGPAEESTDKYYQIQRIMGGLKREVRREEVNKLNPDQLKGLQPGWEGLEENAVVIAGDYNLDEKSRTISLTEQGGELLEDRLRKNRLLTQGGLFDFENMDVLHHVNQALKANYMFRLDVDYVVKDNKVVIVDEFTGRLMPGRRFSDGLHQALEAKEGVTIERESQTYATITFQNYFRMYKKLSGMTGTAKTEEDEFIKIYGMEVLVIPTNRSMIRQDLPDVIYKTKAAKKNAIVEEIKALHAASQPVLVGTISIEASEELSRALEKSKVPHTVLNAKHHEQEAEIIAHAGEVGRVTIATNMAGRGTDIKLGPGAADRGGLFILGTERHESRRIDNQLRGRSGRQGDPGASRFFLSLEDDLMRIFGGERIANLMTRMRVADDEAITHMLISRAIENAQKKVEAHNFELRKHVLEYDDVMNKQREIIYGQRLEILGGEVENVLLDMADETLEEMVSLHLDLPHREEWDVEGMNTQFMAAFGHPPEVSWNDSTLTLQDIRQKLMTQVENIYLAKRQDMARMMEESKGSAPTKEEVDGVFHDFERHVLLNVTDSQWKDHLLSMDHLREGIGLVGYAQKKPIDEYKRSGFALFTDLMARISQEAVTTFFRAHFGVEAPQPQRQPPPDLEFLHPDNAGGLRLDSGSAAAAPAPEPARRKAEKLGRNDPCHCGSGKKYKNCHMAKDGG
ncbi:MAG: preprotein translocase subunit SecA [Deltaproteobacteria bacterium]|nr:preprotein translocase subunit SecA [Deltaproteobacteria bacterium]